MPANWGTLTGMYWLSSRDRRRPPHSPLPEALASEGQNLKLRDSGYSGSLNSLESSGLGSSIEVSDDDDSPQQLPDPTLDFSDELGSMEHLSLPDPSSPTSEPELLYDQEDELACCDLLVLVEHLLHNTHIPALRCSKFIISDQLLGLVGRDLLNLSSSEPCGLRGALVDVFVEHGKAVYNIGQLTADPAVVPTFKLNLVLILEAGIWPRIQSLFSAPPAITPGFGQTLKLGPEFRVQKKKLYSSDELPEELQGELQGELPDNY